MRRAFLQKKRAKNPILGLRPFGEVPHCLMMSYGMGRERGLVPRTIEKRRGVSLSSRQGIVIIDGEDIPVLADGIDLLSDRFGIPVVEGTIQMDEVRG